MKDKFKYVLATIYILLCSIFVSNIVKADSGWDSSYDSGGSRGGSDWGGSDYSSGGSRSGSSAFNNADTFIVIYIIAGIFYIVYIGMIGKWFKNKSSRIILYSISAIVYCILPFIIPPGYLGLGSYISIFVLSFIIVPLNMHFERKKRRLERLEKEEKIKANLSQYIDISYEELCSDLYNKFIKVQEGWMNFDYKSLMELCGNELYNTYYEELEALKLKNGKNFMSDFELVDNYIENIKKDGNLLEITYILDVKFIDFVLNTETNDIVKGNNKIKLHNKYRLIFTVGKTNVKFCPNCGGKIRSGTTKCSHCDSIIVQGSDDFVLTHKSLY